MEVTWGAVHAEGEIAHVFAGLAEVCHDILHFHVSVPLLYVVCTVVQHGCLCHIFDLYTPTVVHNLAKMLQFSTYRLCVCVKWAWHCVIHVCLLRGWILRSYSILALVSVTTCLHTQ